jgi:hypothetical protein
MSPNADHSTSLSSSSSDPSLASIRSQVSSPVGWISVFRTVMSTSVAVFNNSYSIGTWSSVMWSLLMRRATANAQPNRRQYGS